MAKKNVTRKDLLEITGDDLIREVEQITVLINRDFGFQHIEKAYNDVKKLFLGQYPGYQKCNTAYHDIRHTMTVFLAMVRLIHGACVAGHNFSEKEINIGIISALMHDTGYIQRIGDNIGTGAKYTLVHISRSIDFVKEYYKENEYLSKNSKDFSQILKCTGMSTEIGKIVFSSSNIEIMGKIMGTADLLAQMADRFYLEKLIYLYREFEEARVPGFESEQDLLKKTINFYNITKERLEKDFSNVSRYATEHFRVRFNLEKNLYLEAIDKNIKYLKKILKSNERNIIDALRRREIWPR